MLDGAHMPTHRLPMNKWETEAEPPLESLDPRIGELQLELLRLGKNVIFLVQQILPVYRE